MWDGLPDFSKTASKAYRRDVWATQPNYIEVWVEKDALSGIFEDVLDPYGVTLNVGRGYEGWDSIRNTAARFTDKDKEEMTALYFGDFDPSGEDMVRSLKERLDFFDCTPEVIKCALTHEDIKQYDLPPDPAKMSDRRAAAFIDKYGDGVVELDALPVEVLRDRIKTEVESRLDLDALAKLKTEEDSERKKLVEMLG